MVKQKDKTNVFGIIGLILAFIPYISLFAIPLGIIALARKEPVKILGILTLILTVCNILLIMRNPWF